MAIHEVGYFIASEFMSTRVTYEFIPFTYGHIFLSVKKQFQTTPLIASSRKYYLDADFDNVGR